MLRLKNLNLAIVLAILILVLAVFSKEEFVVRQVLNTSHLSTKVYLWYYLPYKTGSQPEPMEKAKYLNDYNVLYVGEPDSKKIYLTFDDCPNNENINTILDILDEHSAQASFFMTEAFIKQNPDIVKKIVDSGSIVCNHTAHHIDMTKLSFEKFLSELKGVEDAYREVTGNQLIKYLRPPQGKFSELTLSYADRAGYTTVFWSFRYSDWEINNQPSMEKAYSEITKGTHPGEIALLHAQSNTNIKILDRVLTFWEEQGYNFETIDKIKN